MPSPFDRLSRKVRTLFRARRHRDGQLSNGAPDTGTSAALPSMSGEHIRPVLIDAPLQPMNDLGDNYPDSRPINIAEDVLGRLGPDPPVHVPAPAHGIDNPGSLLTPPRAPRKTHTPSPSPASHAGPSYLANAHDFAVSNLTINNSSREPKTVFDYLNPHISHGAAHDSDERCDAPACHQETRAAVLADIVSWIRHGDGGRKPKKIMWLSGPAGAGKTAIAGSVAEVCQEEGLLAASFFFSSFMGSEDRRSKRCVVTTIASHLAEHEALHDFKEALLDSIETNRSAFHKRLREQAKHLILKPLEEIQAHCDTSSWPRGIIIDGLDEVISNQPRALSMDEGVRHTDNDQLEILDVLFTLAANPIFPFRIFISSRPEHIISDFFSNTAHVKLFLDSKYNPDADVRLFLEAKFGEIRRRAGISHTWPGRAALDDLVEMSSGQFIVPATIVRWLSGGVPQQQLKEVLQLGSENAGSRNPFAMVDALYRHILQRAHNAENDPFLVIKWITCITPSMHPNSLGVTASTEFRRKFIEDYEGELNYRLAPIVSLISVPPASKASSPITVYHKSLIDFLSIPSRCADLYVDEEAYESFIAERIIAVLKNNGPAVPPPTPVDLAEFLKTFLRLKLVHNCDFLGPMSECSKAMLASCDVAWWTAVSLTDLFPDGSSLPGDGLNPTKSSTVSGGRHAWVVQGIYIKIHQVMECASNAPSSIQSVTGRTRCHPACVLWRTGILAKARELGWCVHELEEVELDELWGVSLESAAWMFKKVGGERWRGMKRTVVPPCSVCQPMSDST